MKIDITELLIFFDKLLSSSEEEERGLYHFRSAYNDRTNVNLRISLFEETSSISVFMDGETITTGVRFNHCLSVKVLDQERKCLEILHKYGRCFLSLKDGVSLKYEDSVEE